MARDTARLAEQALSGPRRAAGSRRSGPGGPCPGDTPPPGPDQAVEGIDSQGVVGGQDRPHKGGQDQERQDGPSGP